MDSTTPGTRKRGTALPRIAIMVAALGLSALSTWKLVERGRSADARRNVLESATMARGWLRIRDESELDRTIMPNWCERTETGYAIANRFWYEPPGVRLVIAARGGRLESARVEGPLLREAWSAGPADCAVFGLDENDAGSASPFASATTVLHLDCSVGPRRVSAHVKALNCGRDRPPEEWHRRVFDFLGAI